MGTGERTRTQRRPTAGDLRSAHGAVIPDVLGPGLNVLFCGINPGLYSGWTGHHFARPGNRFWPALHRAGFTPRLLRPDEQDELPRWGLGITNIAARATARADELTPEELREGGRALAERTERLAPGVLAVLGVTAYRSAFGAPKARIGPQDGVRVGGVPVWVLPNPSGLNAHWTADTIAGELRRVRDRHGGGPAGGSPGSGPHGSTGR